MATKPWFLSSAYGYSDGMGENGASQKWFTNTVNLELGLQTWRWQAGVKGGRRQKWLSRQRWLLNKEGLLAMYLELGLWVCKSYWLEDCTDVQHLGAQARTAVAEDISSVPRTYELWLTLLITLALRDPTQLSGLQVDLYSVDAYTRHTQNTHN